MPVNISGTWVASADDISNLNKKLEQNVSQINLAIQTNRKQIEDQNVQVRSLQQEMQKQVEATSKLANDLKVLDETFKKAVEDLDKTLTGISQEVELSGDLITEINGHLQASGEAIRHIQVSAEIQTRSEVSRRQELIDRFTKLLEQQKSQDAALHEAFSDIQTNLGELTKAEQEGARLVERSVRMLREAVIQMQSQTQDELLRSTQAIQTFTQTKTERAGQEAETLENLAILQESLRERLVNIEKLSSGLATSSNQAHLHQQDLLLYEKTWRASELNEQAALLIQTGNYTPAISLLEEAIQLAPQDITLGSNLALAYFKSKQYERAETILLKMLEQYPDATSMLNELGVLYLEQKNPQAALPHLIHATNLEPNYAALWLNLGKAHFGCGNVPLAIEAWQHAQQLEPTLVAEDLDVRLILEG